MASNVQAHLQWEWEIEHHSGEHWVVIRPGRRYLSADTFASEHLRSWLTNRPMEIREAHAVNLIAGVHRRLTREQEQWQAPWETERAGEWNLSFDMETLRTLNLSGHAADVSQFAMPELLCLVQKEAVWSEFVTTTEALDMSGPLALPGRGSGCTWGGEALMLPEHCFLLLSVGFFTVRLRLGQGKSACFPTLVHIFSTYDKRQEWFSPGQL